MRWEDDSIRFGDSVRIEPKVRVQADILLWNDAGADRRPLRLGQPAHRRERRAVRPRAVPGGARASRTTMTTTPRGAMSMPTSASTARCRCAAADSSCPSAWSATPAATSSTSCSGRPPFVRSRRRETPASWSTGASPTASSNTRSACFQHADGLDLDRRPELRGALLVRRWPDASSSRPSGTTTTGPTRDLQFGVALVRNTMPEGLNSVVGRSFDGDRFFDRFNVNGQRTRLGAEGLWRGTSRDAQGRAAPADGSAPAAGGHRRGSLGSRHPRRLRHRHRPRLRRVGQEWSGRRRRGQIRSHDARQRERHRTKRSPTRAPITSPRWPRTRGRSAATGRCIAGSGSRAT